DGIRHRRALREGWNSHTGNRQTLSLTEAFVAEKEERLIFAIVANRWATLMETRQTERPTEVESKLISFERGRIRRALEEIASVEIVVAEKLKQFTMIVVGSSAGSDVHDGAGVAAILGAEG